MNKALQLVLCVLAIAAQTKAGLLYAGPYSNHVLGVPPADTPEVAHAKAVHFAAYNAAAVAAAAAPDYDAVAYAPRYVGPLAPPPVLINGVPADTPEVAHAKVAHAVAYNRAAVAAAVAPEHGIYPAGVIAPYAYAGAAPIISADTPEVHAAKVAHFAAHAAAKGLLR